MKNKLVLTLSLAASCLLTNVQAQEAIPVLSTKELVDVCKVSTTGEYRLQHHFYASNNLHLQEMQLLMAT